MFHLISRNEGEFHVVVVEYKFQWATKKYIDPLRNILYFTKVKLPIDHGIPEFEDEHTRELSYEILDCNKTSFETIPFMFHLISRNEDEFHVVVEC